MSSGRQPHVQRAYALRNFILPAALADPTFDEVIVVGEWEPGNGYIYIEVPSVHFSCVDALAQRQAGFERSTGGWVVFQHDDHLLESGERGPVGDAIHVPNSNRADVIVPARYTRLRNVNGERLNNGERKAYVSGHCAIYRREVLERCPWGAVDEVFHWDVVHTSQINMAGYKIEWSDALRCYDCEAGGRPWA